MGLASQHCHTPWAVLGKAPPFLASVISAVQWESRWSGTDDVGLLNRILSPLPSFSLAQN